jgi:hypothetical protein
VNTKVTREPDARRRGGRYGFSSGLVPGVDVLAYLAHGGVEAWGAEWLGGGRMTDG